MTSEANTTKQKAALRRQLRQARRALSPRQQKRAAKALRHKLNQSPWKFNTKSLSAYIAFQGEISPEYIIKDGLQRGIECYLPVLHPVYKDRLAFCRYDKNTIMVSNRFGIQEPDFRFAKTRNPRFISLVLTPLVGFDAQGNRLGMGGGFYDRSMAFIHRWRQHSNKPAQVGLAHHCQKVEQVPTEPWDLKLNGIISDQEVINTNLKPKY